MIDREINLNYYTYGETYFGSYVGMRYAIVMVKEDENQILRFTSWPEPFSYDKTSDDQKTIQDFPFTEEGYDTGVAWLNLEYKEKYKSQ